MKRVFPLFLLALALAAVPASGSAVYQDPILEARLSVERVYVTTGRESLQKLAYSIYGHRSWWRRLAERNPELPTRDGKARLPRGTRVTFLAPFVGEEHVVQERETLSRIALWKYGDWRKWRLIYEANRARIRDPNVILPGTTLVLVEVPGEVARRDPRPRSMERASQEAAVPARGAERRPARAEPPPSVADPAPPSAPAEPSAAPGTSPMDDLSSDVAAMEGLAEPEPRVGAPPRAEPPPLPPPPPPPARARSSSGSGSVLRSVLVWALGAGGAALLLVFLMRRRRESLSDLGLPEGGPVPLPPPGDLPELEGGLEDRPRYESLLRVPLRLFKKGKGKSGGNTPPKKAA